jgi:protein ImuA
MSPSGRSEEVGVLREAIARIESDGHGAAPSFGGRKRARRVALGQDSALDRALKGGLGRGALHEIVAASPGDAPAACGFALALAARFAAALGQAAPIVWIVEDHAKAETGMPYAPGLAAHGIDPARLVVVATATGQDSFWAMEEALKCTTVAAVVGEIWRLKAYDLAASRRLVLAAQKSGTPGLLVPAGAAGRVDRLSSAARTRFEVKAIPGQHGASAGGRTPLPGLAAWAVRIARIRAGPGASGESQAALDQDRFWPVLWDHEQAYFRDALPLPVSAPARDRPRRTAARVIALGHHLLEPKVRSA